MGRLTRREREVLALLARGAGNVAIAEALVISPETRPNPHPERHREARGSLAPRGGDVRVAERVLNDLVTADG